MLAPFGPLFDRPPSRLIVITDTGNSDLYPGVRRLQSGVQRQKESCGTPGRGKERGDRVRGQSRNEPSSLRPGSRPGLLKSWQSWGCGRARSSRGTLLALSRCTCGCSGWMTEQSTWHVEASEYGFGSRNTYKTRTELEYTDGRRSVREGDNQEGRCNMRTLDCNNSHSDIKELLRAHKALQGCQTHAAAIKVGARTSTRPGIVMRLTEVFSNRNITGMSRTRLLPNE